MSAPLISIVTPTMNSAATLQACLDSVRAQQYPHWEHLIVDGVSRDDTCAVAQRAAAADARVSVVSEADAGIYDAMNKGLRRARGHWVQFLGADDSLYDAQVLHDLMNAAAPQTELLYGDVCIQPSGYVYGGAFDLGRLFVSNISHQAIVYRRALLQRKGGFELRFPVFADWAFNLHCFSDTQVQCQHVERLVARYAAGGTSARGQALDPAWRAERARLLAAQLGLDAGGRDLLLAVLAEFHREDDATQRKVEHLQSRLDGLSKVYHDLTHSRAHRLVDTLKALAGRGTPSSS